MVDSLLGELLLHGWRAYLLACLTNEITLLQGDSKAIEFLDVHVDTRS